MTEPGYAIGRDGDGLTARERETIGHLAVGRTIVQTAGEMGVSKQRVNQIVRSLETKGRVRRTKGTFEIVVPRGVPGE